MTQQLEQRLLTRVKESGARCTCGWDNGNHAPECDLDRAYWRAKDQAEDELTEADEGGEG
jgi:hypothetical protein